MLRRDFFTTMAGILSWLGLSKAASLTKPLDSVGLDFRQAAEQGGYELETTEFESSESYTPQNWPRVSVRESAYGGGFVFDDAKVIFLEKGELVGRGTLGSGRITYQQSVTIFEEEDGTRCYRAGRVSGSLSVDSIVMPADEWRKVTEVFGDVCHAKDLQVMLQLGQTRLVLHNLVLTNVEASGTIAGVQALCPLEPVPLPSMAFAKCVMGAFTSLEYNGEDLLPTKLWTT